MTTTRITHQDPQYTFIRELLEQVPTRQDIANLRREFDLRIEGVHASLEAISAALTELRIDDLRAAIAELRVQLLKRPDGD